MRDPTMCTGDDGKCENRAMDGDGHCLAHVPIVPDPLGPGHFRHGEDAPIEGTVPAAPMGGKAPRTRK